MVTPAPDGFVLPFYVHKAKVSGRLVRLGTPPEALLQRRQYPVPAARLLAETMLITALLGVGFKHRHCFTLHAQGDGAFHALAVDSFANGMLRGYVGLDAERLQRWMSGKHGDSPNPFLYLGKGHLALTLDQGAGTAPYQGITALDGTSLTAAVLRHLELSEQILSLLHLSLAQIACGAANDEPTYAPRFKGAAMLLQKPGRSGESVEGKTIVVPTDEEEADRWHHAGALFKTVTDAELLADEEPELLLYRLFHQDGLEVYAPEQLHYGCTCSQHKAESAVAAYPPETKLELAVDGVLNIDCHFCGAQYKVLAA